MGGSLAACGFARFPAALVIAYFTRGLSYRLVALGWWHVLFGNLEVRNGLLVEGQPCRAMRISPHGDQHERIWWAQDTNQVAMIAILSNPGVLVLVVVFADFFFGGMCIAACEFGHETWATLLFTCLFNAL